MFDPTAFDNMKVVLEGALYDLDLKGDIVIADRNDIINTAKWSRLFEAGFTLPDNNSIMAKFVLKAELENLAAELLPGFLSEQKSGCFIRLSFLLLNEKITDYQKVEKAVSDIWGSNRSINHAVTFDPLHNSSKKKYEITVDFERIISEDQMDDLIEMVDFMIMTLKRLQTFLEG